MERLHAIDSILILGLVKLSLTNLTSELLNRNFFSNVLNSLILANKLLWSSIVNPFSV